MIRRLSAGLIGPHASTAELALSWGAAFAAAFAQAVVGGALGWTATQIAVAVAFAFDVGGGVVVNSTRSGSAFWSRPERRGRAVFYAGHLHPLVVAALWPDYPLRAALGTWAGVMLAAAIVTHTPRGLQRPVAALLTGLGVAAMALAPMPPGLAWLGPLLLLKLIVGHAVPPEARAAPPR